MFYRPVHGLSHVHVSNLKVAVHSQLARGAQSSLWSIISRI